MITNCWLKRIPRPIPFQEWIPVLCLLVVLSPAVSADYTFNPPPTDVLEDLEVVFSVSSNQKIRLEPEPEHPRLLWLPTSLDVGKDPFPGIFSPGSLHSLSLKQYTAKFRFIPRGTGSIMPPPVPVSIGGQRILLRLPKLNVKPNKIEGETTMIALWNGKLDKPESLRIGETVDLEILAISPIDMPLSPQSIPKLKMEPVRWYRATVPNLATATDLRFFRFGHQVFERARSKFRGRDSWVHRYKTRFTVLPGERLKGVIGLTLSEGYGSSMQTHHETLDVPLSPLPPLPQASYTQTGLVGDCRFEAFVEPAKPTSDKPFTITIDMEATGDAKLLLDLDFARAGFRSIESNQRSLPGTTFDKFRGRFTQTLIADGSASTFPAISLLNFDTPSDKWKIHKLTEAIHFADLGASISDAFPLATLGPPVERPVFLNLHPAVFAILGAAPFLPIIATLVARQRSKRDPARNERIRKLNETRRRLRRLSDEDVPALLDDEAMPLLRAYCHLPDGASTREVADALEKNGNEEFGALLRKHADASFSNSAQSPVTRKSLTRLLAKISFVFLVFLGVPALASDEKIRESLDQAATDFNEGRYESASARYESLLKAHPNRVAIHFNLARTRLAADRLHSARASAHTAVLLDPLNHEARELLNTIHRRLGDPPLPGSAFLAQRPDQLLTFAAVAWGLAFVLLALRRLSKKIPVWPAILGFIAAAIFLGSALWRNSNAYSPDQYMIIAEEVPREREPGKPSYDFPPLRSGAIVRADVSRETPDHVLVETSDTSFWLPVKHLQKIW